MAIFGPENPNPEFPLVIFCPFFSFNNKNTKISWNPDFYSGLTNLKKTIFKFKLKTQKIEKKKKLVLHPFFWKRLFLDNCQIIGHKKNAQNDNCVCQKSLETPIFIG